MANMGYCRFQNAFSDLNDCYENIDDTEEMSEEELSARKRLIKLCAEIALDYGDVVEGVL